jgi:hypothetical protein
MRLRIEQGSEPKPPASETAISILDVTEPEVVIRGQVSRVS